MFRPRAGDEAEEEWFRHHLVDGRTGAPGGEITLGVTNPYEGTPLGDGSWLTGGHDGHPVRRSRTSPPSAQSGDTFPSGVENRTQ
ncbi:MULTISPECIES: hypothetical protein [Streptomyces]|uniref:Uncharacterized protein n=1 Tax=Streptomyces spororaveus TaxID=284039 RepID=A0ABQ3TPZ3_9ACTN|nr:hypothetical protein [Streptomyces spororaveus]GHI82474.1 hypothetical protein Sspor_80350 [Streptomyces spororaveus]